MAGSNQSFGSASAFAERRAHFRQIVRSVSYIDLGDGNGGIILNISEGGLSVHAVTSLTEDQVPRMRFQLSSPKDWLESSGSVTWTGESRRVVGVKFVNLAESVRAKIAKYIAEESASGESRQGPSAPSEAELFSVPPVSASTSAPAARPAPVPSRPVHAPTEPAPAPAASPVRPPPRPFSAPKPPETSGPTAPPAYKAATPPATRPSESPIRSVSKPTAVPTPLGVVGQPAARAPAPIIAASPLSVPASSQRPSRRWLLVALLGFLSGAAVVAGSFAGRAGLKNLIAAFNAKIFAGTDAPVQTSAPRSIGAAEPVSEFEVSDLTGQRRMIPFQPSAPSPDVNRSRLHEDSGSTHTSPTAPASAATEQAPAAAATVPPAVDDTSNQPNVASSSVLVASSDSGQTQDAPLQTNPQPSDHVQPSKIIHMVNPIYPEIAIGADIEGTVKIRATIAQDGSIASLQGISGPDALMDVAMNAVRQWRYAPALLDGKPVEHMEDISIVFRLPQPKH